MNIGAEITRKIDESGLKEKLADGTLKLIDSSKEISTNAIQAASSTFNNLTVIFINVYLFRITRLSLV